jgi:hypothetical protein
MGAATSWLAIQLMHHAARPVPSPAARLERARVRAVLALEHRNLIERRQQADEQIREVLSATRELDSKLEAQRHANRQLTVDVERLRRHLHP